MANKQRQYARVHAYREITDPFLSDSRVLYPVREQCVRFVFLPAISRIVMTVSSDTGVVPAAPSPDNVIEKSMKRNPPLQTVTWVQRGRG